MASDVQTVKDLVIPLEKYPHLNEDQTLHDAVEVIRSYTCEHDRIRYVELLVFNDQKQLSGRVTLQDILQNLVPRFKEASTVKEFEGKGSELSDLSILWEDSFFAECTRRSLIPIRDFISPIKHIAKGSDPVLKALIIMLKTNSIVLPVVETDRVIGVIRLTEIFKAIADRCRI